MQVPTAELSTTTTAVEAHRRRPADDDTAAGGPTAPRGSDARRARGRGDRYAAAGFALDRYAATTARRHRLRRSTCGRRTGRSRRRCPSSRRRLASMREVSPFWFDGDRRRDDHDRRRTPRSSRRVSSSTTPATPTRPIVPSITDGMPAGEMAAVLADPTTRVGPCRRNRRVRRRRRLRRHRPRLRAVRLRRRAATRGRRPGRTGSRS